MIVSLHSQPTRISRRCRRPDGHDFPLAGRLDARVDFGLPMAGDQTGSTASEMSGQPAKNRSRDARPGSLSPSVAAGIRRVRQFALAFPHDDILSSSRCRVRPTIRALRVAYKLRRYRPPSSIQSSMPSSFNAF